MHYPYLRIRYLRDLWRGTIEENLLRAPPLSSGITPIRPSVVTRNPANEISPAGELKTGAMLGRKQLSLGDAVPKPLGFNAFPPELAIRAVAQLGRVFNATDVGGHLMVPVGRIRGDH